MIKIYCCLNAQVNINHSKNVQSSLEYALNRKLNNVMNVNVQEHQRSILAAMGIEVWIPKADVPVRHVQNQLYRDVTVEEVISNVQFKVDLVTSETTKLQINSALEAKKLSAQEHSIQSQKTLSTDQVEVSTEAVQENIVHEVVDVQKIAAFELQAFCLKSCVIIVDTTQINAEQQKLWSNIQNVLLGEYFELKWPFPVMQFQDGRGASIYIQGFLDAVKQDKVLLSLGKVSHLSNVEMIQLASLQEMLEQPKLKRRLWQFMQK